jgi:hypothetical protein
MNSHKIISIDSHFETIITILVGRFPLIKSTAFRTLEKFFWFDLTNISKAKGKSVQQ